MANITLSALLNPLPVQGVQSGSVSNNVSGHLVSILANLPPGALINGFVLNRDAQGNPILRTADQGDLLIKTDLFLKIGSDVVVRIDNATSQKTTAHIVTIDGLPPAEAQARSPLNINDPVQAQPATRPATSPTPQQATTAPAIGAAPAAPPRPPLLKALVIASHTPEHAPAPTTRESSTSLPPIVRLLPQPVDEDVSLPPAARASTLPTLPPATTVEVRVLRATPAPSPLTELQAPSVATSPAAPAVTAATQALPQGAQALPPTAPAAAGTAPAVPALPTSTTAAPPAAEPAAPAVQTSAPVSSAPAAPAAPPAAQTALPTLPLQLEAVVISSDYDAIIVRTEAGNLRVPGFTQLPAGSKLLLEVVSTSAPATAAPTLPATPATPAELSRQWSSLQEILRVLTQDPDFTVEQLAALIAKLPFAFGANAPSSPAFPQPPALASSLLFFLSALKGESFRHFLGEQAVQSLQKGGHKTLLERAEAEFSTLQMLATPRTQESWQSFLFPILAGEHVPMARMFVRRERKSRDGREEDVSRFIVEVDLSQLGELQLDGWIRQPSPESTIFDLMIRSRQPLPEEMQREIIGIYDSVGQWSGFTGKLLFQQVLNFALNPMENLTDFSTPPDFVV